MKYRVDYALHIDVEAKGQTEAFRKAKNVIACFDLNADLDLSDQDHGEWTEATVHIHDIPFTITQLDGG